MQIMLGQGILGQSESNTWGLLSLRENLLVWYAAKMFRP